MLERTLTLFNKDLESLRVLGSLHIVIWCFERITLADMRVVSVYRGAEFYGTGPSKGFDDGDRKEPI